MIVVEVGNDDTGTCGSWHDDFRVPDVKNFELETITMMITTLKFLAPKVEIGDGDDST